jgi:glycosyltransferase involved in cell wall biosynthesis
VPSSPASSGLRATVVVCTHNRSTLLAPCLESLALQTLPPREFEIIVVDDGSTDATPAVCACFNHLPHLRVIRQANAGLGAARERGWRAGSAPVVAFLDDDAQAPPDWLALALARFDRNAATPVPPAALGGPTRGKWEAPRPPWLDDSLAIWLTVWNPFAEYRESSDEHLFVGANMFFLRTALETVNGFNPTLGRRGASLLSHEESELWSRLQASGFRAAYDPAVWVFHYVPVDRLTKKWFRRRIYWEGISLARRAETAPNPGRAIAMVFGSFFSRVVLSYFIHPAHWGRSIAWQCHLAYKFGYAAELVRKR